MTEHPEAAKARIIIVEDEAVGASRLKTRLENLGYTVSGHASSAQQALELIGSEPPDLVLMDMILQGEIDGIEAAGMIRSRWAIPVIFTAACMDKERLERAKPTHPFGYLIEPYQDRDIAVTIEMAIYVSKVDWERREAEKALRESEEHYRQLVDISPDGIALTDRQGRIAFTSPKIYSIFGIEPGVSVIGESVLKWIHPEHREIATDRIQKLIAGEIAPSTFEYKLLKHDGTPFWGELLSTALRNAQGEFKGLMSLIRDITRRRRADEELRESQERFKRLAEATAEGIFIHEEGRVIDVNQSMARMLGYEVSDLIGQNALSVCTAPESRDHVLQHIRSGSDQSCEAVAVRKDGSRFPVEFAGRNLKSKDKILRVVVLRDISERKRTEEELKQTLESLRRAVGTTIQVMVSAVEARDPYTAGHQMRAADLSRAIAVEMGLPQEKIDGMRMAGSIHDIGKLSIPAEILSKPTRLAEIEFSLIKEHPRRGYEMLKDVESPWPLAEIVYQHHERMDGSGYPRNLRGEDILMEARILAVADVVEAMASHRPYRPAIGIDAALEEIEKHRGILYDAAVAGACLRLFREKGFKLAGT